MLGIDGLALPLGVLARIVRRLSEDPRTELGRIAADPAEAAGYGRLELLLFDVVDALHTANWQRSKNASEGNRPKPISPLAKQTTRRHGQTDQPPHKVLALLRKLRPQRDHD